MRLLRSRYSRRFRWIVLYDCGQYTTRLTKEEARGLQAVFGGRIVKLSRRDS